MQQQQAESAAQLQEALAQQAAQSAAAINDMKSAATAAAIENEAGVSAYQQDAINRGISADVLERKKIGGQVMTEIEDAEVSLKEAKTAMQTAFEYAHCDNRGSNCEGPKRIKKWRELALKFVDPYNNSIDKIYDALMVAQSVGGIDLSDIYMMLNNSCNSWGQYMCQNGKYIEYTGTSNGGNGTPLSCSQNISQIIQSTCDPNSAGYNDCIKNVQNNYCKPCTLLKVLTNKDEVYEGWVNPTVDESSNGTVIACASGALDSSAFFAARARRKNGANLVDIDKMETWLNQREPNYKVKTDGGIEGIIAKYCGNTDREKLESAVSSKVAPAKSSALCVKDLGGSREDKDDCPYISPTYAICDIHPYNAGKSSMTADIKIDNRDCTADTQKSDSTFKEKQQIVWAYKNSTGTCEVRYCRSGYKVKSNKNGCEKIEEDDDDGLDKAKDEKRDYDNYMSKNSWANEVKEIVGLKTTVISQQMYKEYEYLNATIRRLKTQLEKATLNATLEAAGAKTESSSSGLLGASSNNADKTIHLAGAENCANKMSSESVYSCVQTNVSLIISSAASNTRNACKQLNETINAAATWDLNVRGEEDCKDIKDSCNKNNIVPCAQKLNVKIAQKKEEQSKNQRQIMYMPMQ